MASGHVNRVQRPNTWLLRPMLLREENPCQPGAVHTWPSPLADAHGSFGGEADNVCPTAVLVWNHGECAANCIATVPPRCGI
jgi:hypothetical protein